MSASSLVSPEPEWAQLAGFPAIHPYEAALALGLRIVSDHGKATFPSVTVIAALEPRGTIRLYAEGIASQARATAEPVESVEVEAVAHEVLHEAARRAGCTVPHSEIRSMARQWRLAALRGRGSLC